jgi:hypothetical protein
MQTFLLDQSSGEVWQMVCSNGHRVTLLRAQLRAFQSLKPSLLAVFIKLAGCAAVTKLYN